jgi:FkbM family methyltransferase
MSFFNAIRRSLRAARVRTLTEPEWHQLPSGWIKLDPSQYMDREILIGATWEPALEKIIRHSVREGETCIDVGAHIGYISCIFAEIVGKNGLVLSFEPDPRVFKRLLETLERNQNEQVKAFSVALGAEDGVMPLTLTKTLGWSSQYPNPLALSQAFGAITVPKVRLDAGFMSMLSKAKLTFLKIDAEGSEPEIWKGMIDTIRAHKPLIAMEINYQSLKAGGFRIEDLRDLIMSSGYDLFFEPTLKSGRCVLQRVDITEERPLLIDTLLASRESACYDRVRDLVE